MASIKDVAERAGVTVTTVSRVLNNRGYISEKTRKKVHEAMMELDYQPNEIARALFRRRSNIIGLIIPNVAHPFFSEFTSYVELHAFKRGYKVLLCNSYRDDKKEKSYIDMLKRNQVDGIIMSSHTLDISEYLSIKAPVISIDRFLSEDIPYITSDNYNGGVLATQLLIDKGCKMLAHIGGSLFLNSTANERHLAFVEVAEKNNVKHIEIQTKLNNFENNELTAMITELFKSKPYIDGVFASSDLLASIVIDVCHNLGKKIPEDVKIVGFDDINIASLMVPSITTIRQPIEKLAETAVEVVIKRIEGKPTEEFHILPVELIERETT